MLCIIEFNFSLQSLFYSNQSTIITQVMIGLVRKIVAGPKNRTNWNGVELDLTYITDRLIAMAYPASGIQKTYRNSINDVAQYFNEVHHGNYLVINISMRKYDYNKFDGKVLQYFWPDHQAPNLTTMFQICEDVKNFLSKSKDGVVTFHCNHGKGRTGTSIISFMLYARQFESAQSALSFYNKKRFIVSTYGVDQPCQRRYLDFTDKMLKMKEIPRKLKAYRLVRVATSGLDPSEYYLQISVTRTGETKHTKLGIHKNIKNNTIPLIADIFIQLYELSWKGPKQAARINFNLFFLQYSQKLGAYEIIFKSKNIKVNNKSIPEFQLELLFLEFCDCHLKEEESKKFCDCEHDRTREEQEWRKMIDIIYGSRKIGDKEMARLAYGQKQEFCKMEQLEGEEMQQI